MKTIEQLAREAEATPYTNRHYPDRPFFTFSPEKLQRFHGLAIAQYREGLLAGVGEPQKIEQTDQYGDAYGYTADQMRQAIKDALARDGSCETCKHKSTYHDFDCLECSQFYSNKWEKRHDHQTT